LEESVLLRIGLQTPSTGNASNGETFHLDSALQSQTLRNQSLRDLPHVESWSAPDCSKVLIDDLEDVIQVASRNKGAGNLVGRKFRTRGGPDWTSRSQLLGTLLFVLLQNLLDNDLASFIVTFDIHFTEPLAPDFSHFSVDIQHETQGNHNKHEHRGSPDKGEDSESKGKILERARFVVLKAGTKVFQPEKNENCSGTDQFT
jgi:hypothetical protein